MARADKVLILEDTGLWMRNVEVKYLEGIWPGDIIVVRTPDKGFWTKLADRLIRFGAALKDQSDLENHVVVYHHCDSNGTMWGIEGRPGGVGWVDVSRYANPYALSNAVQPKTPEQRALICKASEGLLGVEYDWTAIGLDTLQSLSLINLWKNRGWGDKPPAHVVCSSLADYIYRKVGLDSPGLGRFTTPAGWAEFIINQGWAKS